MHALDALERELQHLIVDTLMLEDVRPHDIDTTQPLFNEGLGLDSIDGLELGMAIAKKYNIKMSQNPEENNEHFANVKSLASFVQQKMLSHEV